MGENKKTRFRHIYDENKQPRATIAYEYVDEEKTKLALSRCNKEYDHFEKKLGREIAEGRLHKHAGLSINFEPTDETDFEGAFEKLAIAKFINEGIPLRCTKDNFYALVEKVKELVLADKSERMEWLREAEEALGT